jgi:CspA family cold shock protein
MPEGVIVFFDPYKGFGSVLSDETNTEIFVHINGLVDQIYKGNKVVFDLLELDGKLQAMNVKLKK